MTETGKAVLRTGAASIAALAVALAAAGSGAQSAPDQPSPAWEVPTRTASSGVIVPLPDISRLDCRDMASALRRIDQTGYRQGVVVTEGHPDRPIFDYEDRLARVYYDTCLSRRYVLDDSTGIFVHGFRNP